MKRILTVFIFDVLAQSDHAVSEAFADFDAFGAKHETLEERFDIGDGVMFVDWGSSPGVEILDELVVFDDWGAPEIESWLDDCVLFGVVLAADDEKANCVQEFALNVLEVDLLNDLIAELGFSEFFDNLFESETVLEIEVVVGVQG